MAKELPERGGLKLQVVEFSYNVQPNAALAAGDLDANSYQHKPCVHKQVKDCGYKFASVRDTVNFRSASTLSINATTRCRLGSTAADFIAQERAKNPYVHIIAVREQDTDKAWVGKLVTRWWPSWRRRS